MFTIIAVSIVLFIVPFSIAYGRKDTTNKPIVARYSKYRFVKVHVKIQPLNRQGVESEKPLSVCFVVRCKKQKNKNKIVLDVERRFHSVVYTNTTESTGRLLAVVIDVVFVRRASRLTYTRLYMYALTLRIDSIGVSIAYRRILIGGTGYKGLSLY